MKRKILTVICACLLVGLMAVSLTACTYNFNIVDPISGESKNVHLSIGEKIGTEDPESVEDKVFNFDETEDGYNISIGSGIQDIQNFIENDLQDALSEENLQAGLEEVLKSVLGENYEETLQQIGESLGDCADSFGGPAVIEDGDTPEEDVSVIEEEVVEEAEEVPVVEEAPAAEEVPVETPAVEEAPAAEGAETITGTPAEPGVVFDEAFAESVHVAATGWYGLSADKKQIKIEMDTDPDENFGWSVRFSNDALVKMSETGDAPEGAHTEYFAEDKGTDYGIFKGRRASDGTFKVGDVSLIFEDVNGTEVKVAVSVKVHINDDGTMEIID